MKYIFIILLFISNLAYADPFIVSSSSNDSTQPTHCYFYLDGSGTPIKNIVNFDSANKAFCRIDIGGISVAEHTAEISFAYEVGGILQVESSKTTLPLITKENCDDTSLCVYKYQFKDIVIWYK